MKNLMKEISPFNNVESNNKILYVIKVLLKTLLVYFVSLIIAGILVTILTALLGYDPSGEDTPFNVMLLLKYYGYIATIFAFVLFILKFDKSKLEEFGINKNIKTFFKGIIIGLVGLLSIIILLIIFGQIKFVEINSNVNYIMIVLFIGAFLVQSFMEEFICRGYLLNKLSKKVSIFLSIFISFMFFAVFHFFELFNDGLLLGMIGVLNLFLISVIWALLSLKSKNIYSAIGFHFIWNFCLFSIIGLNLSGVETDISLFSFTSNNSFLSGGSYGVESSIITTIILFIILIISSRKLKLK